MSDNKNKGGSGNKQPTTPSRQGNIQESWTRTPQHNPQQGNVQNTNKPTVDQYVPTPTPKKP